MDNESTGEARAKKKGVDQKTRLLVGICLGLALHMIFDSLTIAVCIGIGATFGLMLGAAKKQEK